MSKLWRWLYSLILYLATPLILLRLLWRARLQPEYRQQLHERWGIYLQTEVRRPLLWLHAVSVGETRAAEPLIKALQATYPQHQILLTCMTPTGRETGRQLYGHLCNQHGAPVIQAYLPYDYPGAMRRFLRHFQPELGLLMETEIWPNLLAAAQAAKIPLALVNARLSARSAQGYARIAGLSRPALGKLSRVAAQTAADAERLAQLGAPTPQVCGNLKFDVSPAPDRLALGATWRQAIGERPIFLAASTREGEEELLLAALFNHPLCQVQGFLLVLVPRHPQRFAAVAQLLASKNIRFCQRSDGLPTPETQVWLGDSMGEMVAYYRLADLALIGGSLLPLGGQNLIEAAACGCPVLVGAHMFNFAQATSDAVAAGAAIQATDLPTLLDTAHHLFQQRQELAQMLQASHTFAQHHRGATTRTLAVIAELLPPKER